jgi:hypothetical protein
MPGGHPRTMKITNNSPPPSPPRSINRAGPGDGGGLRHAAHTPRKRWRYGSACAARGGADICPPSPPPSPTRGEGEKYYFQANFSHCPEEERGEIAKRLTKNTSCMVLCPYVENTLTVSWIRTRKTFNSQDFRLRYLS